MFSPEVHPSVNGFLFFFYRPPPCSAQGSISNTHIQTTFWLLKRGQASTSQVQALACRKCIRPYFSTGQSVCCLTETFPLNSVLVLSDVHYWTVTPSLWGQAEEED